MRKRLGFLGLLASLIIVFFSNSSFAAGYSCTKTYLSCKPGYYLSGEDCLVCPVGKYCTGGTTAPQNCPAGTYRNTTGGTASSSCTACSTLANGFYPNSAAGSDAANDCYTNSLSGKYVASAKASSATNCSAGYYKGSHTVKYGSTSSCSACTGATYSAAGASSCTSCPSDSSAVSINTNDRTSRSGCYATYGATNLTGNDGHVDSYRCMIDSSTDTYGVSSRCRTDFSNLTCAAGYYSSDKEAGYSDTYWSGKTSFLSESCRAVGSGYYSPADSLTRTSCTSLGAIYTASDSGYDASTDCYATTSAGKWLASAKATAFSTCSAGDYCPGSIKVYYNSTGGKKDCPSNYPNSGSGSSLITQCYSNTKSRAWTGSQVNGSTPTNCYSVTSWNSCSNPACSYVAYSNSAGTGDGTIKSGCSSNSTNCTKTADTTTGKAGYYGYTNGTGQACSSCSSFSSSYPSSDNGAANSNYCYATKTKTGSQLNGPTPTNCYSVTSWNSCSPGSCTYKDYYGISDTTCTPSNCTKTPASVTAKSGYYVNGVTCSACSGLASGFYPNSSNGNTGGTSACYTNSLSGKYVASAKASSATNCSAGYYKGSHTVKYGSTSSCSACTNKPANTIYTGNATSNSCPWACAGGYYLLNGQCTDCGNGYYCVEGSNVRVACSTLVPSSAPTPSALRSLSNGSWSDYNHAVKSSDCICDWYLSDETRTQYLNQTACYNGPSGNDYTHYNWCRTGYYATDPLNFNEWYNSCSPCTNKPAHSKYTSYSTPSVMYAEESNCPWQCDEGYYKSGNSCLECGGNNYYCTGGSRYTVSSGYYSTGGTSTTRTGQSACGGNNYYCSGGVRYTVSSGYYSTGGTSTTRTGQSQCSGAVYCSGGVQNNCPAQTSGWTRGTGTGWTSYSSCYQTKSATAVSSYCSSGQLKQVGASSTTWGTATVSSAFNAKPGSIVSGSGASTTCTQCSGAVYSGGGTATSCSSCPAQTSGWTRGTGTGWTSYSSCYQTKSATAVSSYCSSGQLKQVGASSTTWGTATVSSAFNAKPGAYVTGSGASSTCSQCTSGYYCPGGTTTRQSCSSLADGFYPNSAAGSDAANDCYTNSLSGKYVASAKASSATNCVAGYYKGSHTVKYGSTSSCSACTGATYSAAGASSCTSCPADSSATSISSNNRTSRSGCYATYGSTNLTGNDGHVDSYRCMIDSSTDTYGVSSTCRTDFSNLTCAAGYYSTDKEAGNSDTYWSGKTRFLSATCQAVGTGYYSPADSLTRTACTSVYANTTTTTTTASSSSSCVCKAGYGGTSASSCNACAKGTYKSSAGTVACSSAGSGYYVDTTAATSRKSCTSLGAIYTASDSGYDASTDCYATTSAGKWLASAKATAFSTCSAGDYCPGSVKVYYNSIGGNKDCPSGYPNSAAGSSLITQCYSNTKSRAWTGSQVNGSTPTNCYSVTAWNSCSKPACDYVAYSNSAGTGDGTIKSGCSSNSANCTKSPAAVTAKSGYYVSGVTCPACSGLASGFYPNSNNGNTGGASACYTDSLSGKYVASKNASSAKTCPNWTYKGSHTVKYGSVSSCSSCPALTSGWSKKDSSGTGWTSYTSCVQVSPTPSNCSSGNLKQSATSSTTWGSSSVNTALSASPKYYVNGTSCSACPAGSYCSGGTAAATKCAIGSYSTGTASACTVCGAGKTTSSTGTTGSSSCISCSSISGLSSWATPSWKANSVSNLCTVSTCSANYYKSGNSCPTCSSGTDGLYTKSAAGTTSVNSCYLTTTAGKYVATENAGEVTCAAGGWCPGGITIYYNTGTTTGGRTACSSLGTGYTNTSTGQSKNTSCYLPVTAGKVRVGTSGTSLDTCDAGTYKAAHNAYYGTSYSCSVCDTNKYSDAGAASCTSCDTADGYGNSGTSASSHAGVSSCKVTCDAGEYVATAGGGCVSVGSGYYTSASKTVAQNATSSRSACSSLTGVSVSGGTYSSVSPYNASSTCRYKGPSKTISGCNTVTTNTVAYSGSAWPATTYSVSANAGYYISSNNTASATCSQCTSGYYCPGGTTTRQSCSSLADGFYPNSAAGSDGVSDCYTDSLSGKYVASAKASSATSCSAGYYKGSHTVKYGSISSCSVCANNTYSDSGAASCTSCDTEDGYGNSGTSASSHAGVSSCKVTCDGGSYVATANAACTPVGSGYWAATSVVSQGNTGIRNACDAGLTTIGFGPGADEPADCGRVLNIGDEKIYLRSEKKTTPSLNVSINGDIFYGNMGTSGKGSLKIKSGSTTYSVYDDSM